MKKIILLLAVLLLAQASYAFEGPVILRGGGPNWSAVNIDGGTIDGTAIGGTTPAAGAFTTLSATTFTSPWASVKTVATSGGDYTDISDAVDAASAGDTILVFPGTYTDSITVAVNNLTIYGLGSPFSTTLTQANANVIDFGATTGGRIINFTINLSAATTAIAAVTGSTGSFQVKMCWTKLASTQNLSQAAQPKCGEVTGAGTLQFNLGRATYSHTGTTATGLKAPFSAATGGKVVLYSLVNVDIDGGGSATATAVGISVGTGYIVANRCAIDVDDDTATFTVGMGYLTSGTSILSEFVNNTVHVHGADNNTYGIYSTDGTVRSVANHIHSECSGTGTAYSFVEAGSGTINSHGDDIIATGGYTGNVNMASSEADGEFTVTGALAADTVSVSTGTSTTPKFTCASDENTGQSRSEEDQLSQIAGGVEALRSIEANSVIYNVLNSVQQDTVTDATTNGTTTITKAGENFSTSCAVGDTVLIWGGTTTADYGVYSIMTVTSNTALVLDTAPSGSVSDMDFYVFRGGVIATGESLYQGPHVIKTVDEPALGDRLTIGLDETARTMVICDKGDVDTDFGLSASGNPRLYLWKDTADESLRLTYNTVQVAGGNLTISSEEEQYFTLNKDLAAGDVFSFNSGSNDELTDTNGEQSMVYIEPKINQSGTAAYNGLKVDVQEETPGTSIGDGTTGDGNNLLNLQLNSTTKARIDRTGRLVLAETTTPAALADHAFLYAKDNAGTGNMWVADAAADETMISPHAGEWPEELEVSETYPRVLVDQNHAVGIRRHIAMGQLAELVQKLAHTAGILAADKKIVLFETIEKTQDLAAQYTEQYRQKFIRDNTTEVEIAKADAFEQVDVEERVLYDVEVTETVAYNEEVATGLNMFPFTETVKKYKEVTKTVKQGKKVGETTTYQLSGDEVREIKQPVWEMKTVKKPKLKELVRFDEATGKFYKKTGPTGHQIEDAVNAYVPDVPQWITDRQ